MKRAKITGRKPEGRETPEVAAALRVIDSAANVFTGGHTSQSAEGTLALAFLSALDGEIKPEEAPVFKDMIAALCVIALLAFPVVQNCIDRADAHVPPEARIDPEARYALLASSLASAFDAAPDKVAQKVLELLRAKEDGQL